MLTSYGCKISVRRKDPVSWGPFRAGIPVCSSRKCEFVYALLKADYRRGQLRLIRLSCKSYQRTSEVYIRPLQDPSVQFLSASTSFIVSHSIPNYIIPNLCSAIKRRICTPCRIAANVNMTVVLCSLPRKPVKTNILGRHGGVYVSTVVVIMEDAAARAAWRRFRELR